MKQALGSHVDVGEAAVGDLVLCVWIVRLHKTRCEQAASLLQHVLYCSQREAGAKQPLTAALGVIYWLRSYERSLSRTQVSPSNLREISPVSLFI